MVIIEYSNKSLEIGEYIAKSQVPLLSFYVLVSRILSITICNGHQIKTPPQDEMGFVVT